jgi:hypothetical protein
MAVLEHFVNICFEKPKLRVIMLHMDAIDIGDARRATGVVGRARPGDYAQFGSGLCTGTGAAEAFRAEIGPNSGISI